MAGNYPDINDTKQVLLFKTADNWYQHLVGLGHTGLTPPRVSDPIPSLEKKITYFTALAAE